MNMLIKVIVQVVLSVQMLVSQQRFQYTRVRPNYRIIIISFHSLQCCERNLQSTTERSKAATLMVWDSFYCFSYYISVPLLVAWVSILVWRCSKHTNIWVVMILDGVLPSFLNRPWTHIKSFDTAVSNPCCKVERSARSLSLISNSAMICQVSSAVSSLLALTSGTTAPAGSWSSGSMHLVRSVRKTGGGRVFCFSTSKMNIKTDMPVFDVIQL
jgi:hypothetical protein